MPWSELCALKKNRTNLLWFSTDFPWDKGQGKYMLQYKFQPHEGFSALTRWRLRPVPWNFPAESLSLRSNLFWELRVKIAPSFTQRSDNWKKFWYPLMLSPRLLYQCDVSSKSTAVINTNFSQIYIFEVSIIYIYNYCVPTVSYLINNKPYYFETGYLSQTMSCATSMRS